MSSSIAKGTVAQPQFITSAPSSSTTTTTTTKPGPYAILRPVQIKQTPLAQAARHAVPALQAGLFALRFNALVADPVATLTGALPITAALQVAYAVLCLPVAGSQGGNGGAVGGTGGSGGPGAGGKVVKKVAKPPRIGGEAGRKKAGGGGGWRGAVATSLLSLLLSLLVTPFLYIAMVLFGAPFLTHGAHTLLCAAHLSVLALFPLFFVHGVDGSAWAAVGGFGAPLDETYGGLVGAAVGSWLGAVPIPLDWDRDWQRWPVIIMCGMYGGYVLGRVVGGTLVWGKRF